MHFAPLSAVPPAGREAATAAAAAADDDNDAPLGDLSRLLPDALSFVVQTNSSLKYYKGAFEDPNLAVQLPLQLAVERAVGRAAARDPSLPWRVSLKAFPHPALETQSAVGQIAPGFVLASLMFNFVVMLMGLVSL